MIYEELFNNFDYISYFREKLENKQLISGHTYELKKEDHLIYILVHLAKHFYHAGVGIRMIADVAVFINKFAEILDFEYIDDEMKRLELSEFANVIYFIVNKYFGTDVDCKDISLNSEKRILEYVLNHGVFGFDNKDVDSIMWHSGKEDTFNVLIRKLFPDYRTMVTYFDWFENKPKIMLPYAWLRRWIEYILNPQKRSVIKYKVDTALSKSDDVNIHQDMLEIVGLKK
jgi:hypothetical protein